MADDASRWASHDDAADLLGMPAEAVKRLAVRRGWPRRGELTGGAPVAMPAADRDSRADDVEPDRSGPRSLLDFLETHVDRLTEELAEARTEMRGVRYEAESLRIEAGRAQVLAALVEAERARSVETRAERDRLAAELAELRRPWMVRVLEALVDREPVGRAF